MGVTSMGVESLGPLSLLRCYWLLVCIRSGVFIRDFGLTLLREPKFPPYTLRTAYRFTLVRTVTRELPER